MNNNEPMSYDESMKELDQILAKMEGEDVPIDDLEKNVERASMLLKYCNDRLKKTEQKVSKIIDELDLK